jgi:hypothetical protein
MVSETLSMTPESLQELKRLYEEARPGEVFKFQGKGVLREYAKYLIEYAETRLKGIPC